MSADLMNMLSFFSFNIDVASPECLVPEIEYEYKYYAMMGLPVICVFFIILAWAYQVVYKYCLLQYRAWGRINSHGSMIIGLTLLLLYFFYLELIRRSLDIFNCTPTDPADGNLYTSFTSISCEAGYCVCWEEGGNGMSSLMQPYHQQHPSTSVRPLEFANGAELSN